MNRLSKRLGPTGQTWSFNNIIISHIIIGEACQNDCEVTSEVSEAFNRIKFIVSHCDSAVISASALYSRIGPLRIFVVPHRLKPVTPTMRRTFEPVSIQHCILRTSTFEAKHRLE